MKIDKALIRTQHTLHQSFFLGCWFNLCHEESLDSDRVSILNPKVGLTELLELYNFGNLYGGDRKRHDVASELKTLLANNILLDKPQYKALKDSLASLLNEDTTKSKKHAEMQVNKQKVLITSLCRECSQPLKKLSKRCI